MASIFLDNRSFDYTVTKKPIRSLSLRLRGPASFSVSCPRLTPNFVIQKFISSHSSWIIKQSAKFPPPSQFDSLTILGQEFQIIQKITSRSSVVIFEINSQIYLNSPSLAPSSIKKLLDRKLRPHALHLIRTDLRSLSTLYGFKYAATSIRNQRSRFGSCSHIGNLSFNWQIILFPRPIYLYILLHELTHTLHHNHSPKFWHQLGESDPAYRTHRLWLKKEAQKYLIFSK